MDNVNNKKAISLVLGSGGARGLAHIGIIKWLLEYGYSIQSISGSSIGALVGGIFAAGKLDVYVDWIVALEKVDVIRLLDLSFSRKSLFKGDRIIEILREMIGDHDIERLPISFTAVATDIQEQKEVWLNQGSLFDAIRASIAIPTIFTPHHYMGKIFLDGSLVNPIPIAPTLNDNTDFTIVVNLNGKVQSEPIMECFIQEKENHSSTIGYHQRILQFIKSLQQNQLGPSTKEISLYEIIARSMEAMQGKISRYQLAAYSPDAIVEIPINVCSFYEFYRAQELIDIGYSKAAEHLGKLDGGGVGAYKSEFRSNEHNQEQIAEVVIE